MQPSAKKLFLIDALGALISAFLLGVLLVEFKAYFGIPPGTLYILAAIPVFYAIYDCYAFLKKDNFTRNRLKIIAIANLCYCFVSLLFTIYHYHQILFWGWIYIISELFIVCLLANFELKMVRKLSLVKHQTL
ncbi:hypothetical protein [Crocinitomix algicola]|uniref:hypothetical protein n=1 Tax=Crocinitomix algicola TaxID=1740263 RepID=UPI000836E254|nr:hypothetical protein [Crocinitomix algicola]